MGCLLRCMGMILDLVRCMLIAEVGDEGVQDIGYPCCQDGRRVCIDGKGGTDGLEQDIRETQSQTHTQGQTHAAIFSVR